PDFVDQLAVLGAKAFHDGAFGRAVGDVKNLGDGFDAAGVFEALAHDARHAALEAFFNFAYDVGVGAAHRRDPADDRQATRFGQAREDFRAERRGQMRHDEGDGLWVLVDDVSEQVLAVNVTQKAEWHSLNGLSDIR